MRYFGLDKKSEIRKIILTEVEDDVVGPRNGSDEIISENPTTMYLSGVLFPKETSIKYLLTLVSLKRLKYFLLPFLAIFFLNLSFFE